MKSSILVACWVLMVGAGSLMLGSYHTRPGHPGSPPEHWPAGCRIALDKTRPTLMIFLHPRCPCSRASMAELGRVAAACRGRFAAHLVSFRPEGPGGGWEKVEADADFGVPGLTRWPDKGGREAMRFEIETSGHILLYEPSGRLIFSGGITPARGHEGSNRGLDDLVDSIRGGLDGPTMSPVYGCPVLAPAPAPRTEIAP